MAEAANGNIVRITYTGKLTDGTVFDSSEGREPLGFRIGDNTIIPTLEAAIVGMTIGDTKTVDIAAADAYGPHVPEAIQTVDRSEIPSEVELDLGIQLQATGPDNQTIMLRVTELTETNVTLDANHPLAGQDLTFDIELVEIVEGEG